MKIASEIKFCAGLYYNAEELKYGKYRISEVTI